MQFNVADANLSDTTPAATYNAVEGNATKSLVLATFSDANPVAPLSDYTPAVNWGGTVVGTPAVSVQLVSRTTTVSNWKVLGSVTYAEKGSYGVSISVQDVEGKAVSSSGKVRFNVADAPLTDTTPKTTYNVASGVNSGSVVLATFTDGDPFAVVGDYQPTVTWGGTLIGTPSYSVLFVSADATASNWQVVGSVTYAAAGTYPITVKVADADGSSISCGKSSFKVTAPVQHTTAAPASTVNGAALAAIAAGWSSSAAQASSSGLSLNNQAQGTDKLMAIYPW